MATTTLNKNNTQTEKSNTAPCTVSGIFKTHSQANDVIRKLMDAGVKRENISIIGKDLQSETQITGFLTRSDVIKDGLQSGAIFGALFGTMLSLLSGVGVLFVPFVGTLVAGGPLGAAILGATSGAIAGSAGAGLVSALASLGMPKEKAALYETRIKAGGLLLTAEAPEGETETIENLFRQAGAEEILSCKDFVLSRFETGRVSSTEDLPESIRAQLSAAAQDVFVKVYNQVYAENNNEHAAAYRAWMTIEKDFVQDDQGVWVTPETSKSA